MFVWEKMSKTEKKKSLDTVNTIMCLTIEKLKKI